VVRPRFRAFATGFAPSLSAAAQYTVGAKVAAGGQHSFAILSNGTLYAWGANYTGTLGNGFRGDRLFPTKTPVLDSVLSVVGGGQHSVALRNNGKVWCWGSNFYGQSGRSGTADTALPVLVGGLSNIIGIAAGETHTLAVKNDGSVTGWGNNYDGQLGNDSSGSYFNPNPASVIGLTDVEAVAAGRGFSLALKRDGTVFSWGANSLGVLGNGTSDASLHPTPVLNLNNVVSIAAGEYHAVALRGDGTVWCWGYNSAGQLGIEGIQFSSVPLQVPGISNILGIAAGISHTLALRSDGRILCWGTNANGQLAIDSTNASSFSPVQANGVTEAYSLAAGTHSLVAKSDGSIWGWGFNDHGQIGDGTWTRRFAPALVVDFFHLPRVEAPVLSLPGGKYIGARTLTISCPTPGAVMTYTLNGSEPTQGGSSIGTGITVSVTTGITTLRVKAFKSGLLPSSSSNAFYTIASAQAWAEAIV
jgi:alpha-tubulin suppressor-like RCC1 family protein